MKLARIRQRLLQLGEIDEDRVVFGSTTHEWHLGLPAARADLEAFEQLHDVKLPDEFCAYLERVAASGAGPYYGLLELPMTVEPWNLAAPFVESMKDTSLRGGYLVLADQGCGYKSVLVLNGPRRGEVLADMREAHEGFVFEAASFLEWIEAWLDRAFVEWAMTSLPDIVRRGAEAQERAGVEAAAHILERFVDKPPKDALSTAEERLRSIVYLRVFQGRFDEAVALVDEVGGSAAVRAVTLARIAGAQGDYRKQLSIADAALANDPTHIELLQEKERALLKLDRLHEAIATVLIRARHARDLHAFFDVAWMRIEDGDVAGAADVLAEVAREGIGGPKEGSVAERAIAVASDLLDLLARHKKHAVIAELRELLGQLS